MKIPYKREFIGFLEKRIGYRNIQILNVNDGNDLIASLLKKDESVAIGKIGAVETYAVRNFLSHKEKEIVWSPVLSQSLYDNAGVFPKNNEIFNSFCLEFLESLKTIDLLAVWFNRGESYIVKNYANKAKLTELCALEPYYYKKPWSKYLENKKVLVINPFAKTIKQQYKNRSELWQDQSCLPSFELDTINSPLSDALIRSEFASWLEALQFLKEEMSKKEFDIAIVGAGAYSIPLVAHAKKMGKLGIHLGGATQILFGIKGKRWDNHTIGLKFYNNYWIRPSSDETPGNIDVIEQGCYW